MEKPSKSYYKNHFILYVWMWQTAEISFTIKGSGSLGDFSHSDIFWKSRKWQTLTDTHCPGDSFSVWKITFWCRWCRSQQVEMCFWTLFLQTNKNYLRMWGSWEQSWMQWLWDSEVHNLRYKKSMSRIKTMNFRRVNFDLFKDQLGGIPWRLK